MPRGYLTSSAFTASSLSPVPPSSWVPPHTPSPPSVPASTSFTPPPPPPPSLSPPATPSPPSPTPSPPPKPPLPETGDTFTLAALGKDAELLHSDFISKLCGNPARITVLVPSVPTPDGLVAALGDGLGRRILCPSPVVVGLEEPPVVPDFLRALASRGWVPVRVPAYETRWAGPTCAAELVEGDWVDAVVFTSTAEVEGMLKSLREMGFDWGMVRERRPGMVVAAHGPVTASGAERLGVSVDVVSESFGSFDGVVEALAGKFAESSENKQR